MAKILDFFKIKRYGDVQPHHHHISLLLIGKILLVIVILILIKPAFTGFSISRQFKGLNTTPSEALEKQEKLNLEISTFQNKLENCESYTDDIKKEVSAEAEGKNKCLKEKSQLEIQLEQDKKSFEYELSESKKRLDDERKTIAEQINEEKAKSAEREKNLKELAENSANNICCKLKVDDKTIDSYSISNNKVVCGKGQANSISC